MTGPPETRVLTFIGAYLPGFKGGGPVKSMKNLAERLSPDIKFWIVAPDRDLCSDTVYSEITPRTWMVLNKETVLYLPPSLTNILDVLNILRLINYNIIYLHSFFSQRYTLPVLALRWLRLVPKRPLILAVHGEFSPAALALKPRKKQIYIYLAQRLGFLQGILFHATSPQEEEHIYRTLGTGVKIYVAPNLVDLPPDVLNRPKTSLDILKIVFLGRIVPMKNLDYALEVLANVETPVRFTIYGPIEDILYWERCQNIISELPQHIEVDYVGNITPSEVTSKLSQHDLFFMPTRGENFGHVIPEALSAGCPVLISDQTPWQDLDEHGCGWAFPLKNSASFVKIINKVGSMEGIERQLLSDKAREYMIHKESISTDVDIAKRLFLDSMGAEI